MVFHVHYEVGDRNDEHIYGHATVSFEEKYKHLEPSWDEQQIEDVKEYLASFYGCNISEVRTESEEAQDAIDLERYLDEESKKLNS